jgi:hypothetical protein
MKIWNRNICLTSPTTIMILTALLLSTLVLANVWPEEIEEIEKTPPTNNEETEMWIPTKEDIAYQDSMFTIIQNTQNDVIDIKEDIVHILERLDYKDGTYDSIRYVKNGIIDKRRNQ